MVRVNLVDPRKLADQHLLAEYNEILMLISYIAKYPSIENIPAYFCLGAGHMRFFKDKISYLKKRHRAIKSEMKKRGFRANKTIKLGSTRQGSKWQPQRADMELIKTRLRTKLKMKPHYYRYYGQKRSVNFFLKLLNSQTIKNQND